MATYRKRLRNRNGDFIIPALNGDETGWIQTGDVADGAITGAKIASEAISLTDMPAHSAGVTRYKISRVGNSVVINLNAIWLNSITKDTWVDLGSLPSGLYPSSANDEPCGSAMLLNDSGNVIGMGTLLVGTAGNLTFKSDTTRSALSAIRGSMSYVITW